MFHKCVKTLIFVVNLFFSLLGIAIFAVGIYVLVKYKNLNDLYPEFNSYGIASTIVIGAVVFLISFSGCFGAIKEINCLLIMYVITMLLLAICKTAIGVYIVLKTPEVKAQVDTYMSAVPMAFVEKKVPEEFHVFEIVGQCCGTNGTDSYVLNGMEISKYCCPIAVTPDGSSVACSVNSKDINKNGCEVAIPQFMDNYLPMFSYIFFGVAAFEFVSFVSGMYLMCSRGKREDYYGYD